ncbi:MAG: hypothetical protein ACRDRU_23005 [Pseudonocardiaceae bacterium]
MTIRRASYVAWEKAYGDVYEALPNRTPISCPNCSRQDLKIDFVAREIDRIGLAMFWCDFCLYGIHISRTWAPSGVSFDPLGTPWEELNKTIPEYRIIDPPLDDEGAEKEEDVS